MSRPGGDSSDEALAAAANAGDRGALEVLLARHVDRVHAICRRVTGHPEDALDATQEALIALTRGLHRYDGRALFTTWLYRVATNAALDELRRRKRRPEPAELSDDRAMAGGAGGGVESVVAARLDVDAALAGLSPEFRAAVVLRDLCDLDYAEIAEVLDVPIGTVRSRIARGRAAIADQLREPTAPPERPIG
ncbi:MAG: eukaryotic-like serine/threonine-protein kinase [Actinomycetota bacterium]|jgi:RNA polymerase sigma-70 factor (ECF subfamily)|nr:eukaryotic-like serine/threonine-protein kinase [Actinomycetota bacterium]